LAAGGLAEIAGNRNEALVWGEGEGLATRHGLVGCGTVGTVMDGDADTESGEGFSDTTAETATGTSDKNDGLGIHAIHYSGVLKMG
jgi:hypothetical protein